MPKGKVWRNLTLLSLGLAVLGRLTTPDFLGFTILPLAAALVFAFLAGPARWRADLASLRTPAGKTRLALAIGGVLSFLVILAAGYGSFWPTLDLSPGRTLSLGSETEALLSRLDRPVAITVHLGRQDPREPLVRELMDNYSRLAGGRLSVKYVNPQTDAAADEIGPRLVAPDTAEITAEGFKENISPVTEDSLNGALGRLLHPEYRLIYFLNTFGEKMVQTRGHGGLSQWAEDMTARRQTALDYSWPEGAPLPMEASALVLAGPRAPLGEIRETMLINYLKNGGRLLIMADPLVVAVSRDFWAAFGLDMPDGLVVDPETNLAGTKEAFVVSHDYLPHALTKGLSSPIVWPLTGAFTSLEAQTRPELGATVFGLVQSSPSSWLETDPTSFVDGAARYQAEADLTGPLVLAVAAELKSGGRMLALADSDLAANSFRGFPGNRNFTSAAVNWLLDGESVPLTAHDPTQGLILNHISARLVFWLPTVVWPTLVLLVWLAYYAHRRRRRG